MIKWINSIFAWRLVFKAGAYAYYENAITGKRDCEQIYAGHSPKDVRWLRCLPATVSAPPTDCGGDRR